MQREDSYALPKRQRHLIALILRKLLASSSQAIAATLDTLVSRLETLRDEKVQDDAEFTDGLIEAEEIDGDLLDEILAEPEEAETENAPLTIDRQKLREEIAILQRLAAWARSIGTDTKTKTLLTALDIGFEQMAATGAARKALIFTESRRTQEYLKTFLDSHGYVGQVVLFNGTNGGPEATAIYLRWVEKNSDTGRASGSRAVDMRTALIEHFRDGASILLATEAAAEGINLQFCSLVINYDLPWNPQRIEQLIGRCHRYGQKFDVVVVNFVDRSNEADVRVYELLAQKFQLFEGIFGASDEVLGAIGSGVDFERRIADIYQNCRDPEAIKSSFEQLQLDLSGEINEAMVKTRQLLLENFDEEVQDKLRIRADDASCARNRYERMLMDLTRAELGRNAEFDTDGFRLLHSPCADLEGISLGRYELPRRNGGSHLYRISHPLAAWVTQQAKSRQLPGSRLVFDYDGYGTQVSTLKAYRGQTGWLTVSLISVDALGQQEQHLIVAATTAQGVALAEDDPEKLLRLPAHQKAAGLFSATDGTLAADLATRKVQVLRKINQRNLGYFEQEVEKLDAWADDLKLGLEQEILGLDFEIKEERRTAAISPTLEEKLSHQKRQRDLETKRSKLRRELFTRQDEVEAQRNDLITQLEVQLQQRVEEQTLFTIEWELK